MAEPEKDIIYLDHDAEITEAIEKLKGADGDTVRLVVPGRSGLLQSLVNLKLLKKAADDSKKELVLVTGDKTASNLAGKLGLAVAKNVKATPHVVATEPPPTESPLARDEPEEKPDLEDADSAVPVHRYDNPDEPRRKSKKADKASRSKDKAAKRGGSKVPNYNKFQKWLMIGGGVIAFFLLFWLASAFLQTATINVQATADRHTVDTQFVLSTSANAASGVTAIPLETTKDLSQSFQATGKKDNGTKAQGNVSIKNCEDSDPHPLPAGSKLTTGGKAFVTSAAVTIPAGDFSGGGTVCKSSSVQVAVVAAENGEGYNFTNASFLVSSLSSRVTGTGTTQGGTSKIVTVVTQADVDTAQKTAIEGAKSEALNELKDKAKDDVKVFDDTLTSTVVTSAANPPVDTEGTNGTLTIKVKFTVLTATQANLEAVIKKNLSSSLTNGATVLDAGLDQAKFTQTKAQNGSFTYTLQSTAYIGQAIDKDALAKAAAGKAKRDVADLAREYPNVTSVTVDGWPLVPNMPISASNIKVKVQVSK